MTGGNSSLAVPGSSCEMSPEERVRAFKSDPQLMEAATKFVNEVIEMAKEEAARRSSSSSQQQQQQQDRVERLETDSSGTGQGVKRGAWHSRARSFVARLFASLCLCSSSDVKA